jgi:hypothetical protein
MIIPDQHLAFMPGDWVQIADEKHLSSVLEDRGDGLAMLESLRTQIGGRFRVSSCPGGSRT